MLIDKNMQQPASYSNTVSLEHSHKNLFPVEKDKVGQFTTELEKIVVLLTDKKNSMPESIDFQVGNTRFVGIKIRLAAEERLDLVLTTNAEGTKIHMHVSEKKPF